MTVFEGVPTMYAAMLNTADRDDVRHVVAAPLRLGRRGAAGRGPAGFEDAFGCKVLEGYGLSETSPIASFNHARQRAQARLDRHADRGVEMKLVDPTSTSGGRVGEIAIRGHNVMKGYWSRPDATAEAIDADGWFKTGDMARVDEDGYFFIVDRKKDLIIRGGYNVYPREIEEVLYEHPAVREAAVVGVPHAELGEDVAAAWRSRPDADVDAGGRCARSSRTRSRPTSTRGSVWIVDELPKGPTGKILKREIELPVEVAS